MKKLTQLINCLSDSDITLIRKFYHQKPQRERGRRLELFEYALGDVKSFAYTSASSFSHLQHRLKKDIFEVLLANSQKSTSLSEFNHAYIDIKKNVALARLLYSKGNTLDALLLLHKQIDRAIEFELYGELIFALNSIRNILAYRKDKKALYWNQQIKKAYKSYGHLLEAEEIYNAIVTEGLRYSESNEMRSHKSEINKLAKLYKTTKINRIALMYYVLAVRFYEMQRDFTQAIRLSEEFNELIVSSQSLNLSTNISRNLLDLSTYNLCLGEYKQSFKYALMAYDRANKKVVETIQILKQLFLTALHSENYSKAYNYLAEGFIYVVKEENEYNDQMWSLFEVCYLFRLGKLAQAEKKLKKLEINELKKDKHGWAIGLYYIDILISVERADVDSAAYKVARLYSYLSRHKNKSRRMQSIVKVLEELVKNNLDYKKTREVKKILFTKLANNKNDYYWSPVGYELVEFNHWFRSRLG